MSASFTLPNFSNGSSSSLMDAVVGGNSATASKPPALSLRSVPESPIFGDASSRVNHSDKAAQPTTNGNKRSDGVAPNAEVKELEMTLQKRRSLIPHLESELAALEAQIKAAEERLARVQGNGKS